jgi:short-subunit dehydrogenase
MGRFRVRKESHVALQSGRDLALVTGASSGIGEAIARELAGRKIALVLAARRRERLVQLAQELQAQHGIPAHVVACDLNAPDGAQRLLEELSARQLAPSILINNAGFGRFGPFLEQSPADICGMVEVNARAVTLLARELGAAMAARGHGHILNVASFAALAPIPGYAVYSATKGYVVALTQALAFEWRKSGVYVSVVLPGYTGTEFHEVSQHEKSALMKLTELTPRHVARAAVRGMARGKLIIIPGWWYKLNAAIIRLAPRSVPAAMSAITVK